MTNLWLLGKIKAVATHYGFKADSSTIDPLIIKEIAFRYNKEIENRKKQKGYPDAFKQAGYLAFWIRKLKPLRCTASRVALINEAFAYFAGLAIIDSVHPGSPQVSRRVKRDPTGSGFTDTDFQDGKDRAREKFEKELMYSMRYRPVSPHAMGLVYYAIWNLEAGHHKPG